MNDEIKDRPSEGGNGAEEEGKAPSPETPSESKPPEAAPVEPKGGAAEGGEPRSAPESPTAEPPAPAAPEGEASAPDAEAEAEAKAKAAAEAKAKAEAAAKKKAEHEAREAAKPIWERDPVPPEWEEADDDPLSQLLRERHPDSIESTRTLAGDLTIEVATADICDVCSTLKAEGFTLPVDICGAHYPDRESGRFEVVYHLYSFEANRRIRVKVRTDEEQEVPSVTSVWVGANWHEREAYDMYGIRFSDHPDLTRILLWEGFNGYPLRKDFPVEGIDTGSAIYPEYYEDEAGPIAGTGTGWKPPQPPDPPAPAEEDGDA